MTCSSEQDLPEAEKKKAFAFPDFLGGLRQCDWRCGLYFQLHVLGWMASSILISWGIFVLFFFLIGGLSFDGMMEHLANLAERYVEADATRTYSFKLTIAAANTLISLMVMFLRRHSAFPSEGFGRSNIND